VFCKKHKGSGKLYAQVLYKRIWDKKCWSVLFVLVKWII